MNISAGRVRCAGLHPAFVLLCLAFAVPEAGALTVTMAPSTRPVEAVVEVGGWYRIDAVGGTFQPADTLTHLEIALYDPAEPLEADGTPFARSRSRSPGAWPDGPEDDAGDLGCEVVPDVLCDRNSSPFGEPDFRSLRLFDGKIPPDAVYGVEVQGDVNPVSVWIHPLRHEAFTMSRAILQSGESSLTNPIYGPASVVRTAGPDETTRFTYTGLDPDVATGLKDDYPVQNYGQRPGSHGNGDFGWFPGYALGFTNEGPSPVVVALFMNTGFTGPSGSPTNTLANDTFWKGGELSLAPGDSGVAWLDFADVQAWSIADNPYPHTAGGRAVPNGTAGIAINVFDRLQVSAIGWEVRSGGAPDAEASLLVYPVAASPYENVTTSVAVGMNPRVKPARLPAVPNPFRSVSVVSFDVPEPARARLTVYDVAGRRVRVLLDRVVHPGGTAVSWNGRTDTGREVPPGVYYYRLDLADRPAAAGRVVRIP